MKAMTQLMIKETAMEIFMRSAEIEAEFNLLAAKKNIETLAETVFSG